MPAAALRARGITCLVSVLMCLSVAHSTRAAELPGDGRAALRPFSASDLARLAAKAPTSPAERHYLEMSSMGAMAAGLAVQNDPDWAGYGSPAQRFGRLAQPLSSLAIGGTDVMVHASFAVGVQGETSIAANADASVLVAGYNDLRGFSVTPVSVSGVARSTDGGLTWNEVPVGPGGSGLLPSVAGGQVSGDPDVKFDPTRNRFFYSSIYVRPSDQLQGMCIHYSNADGSVWTGPIEVTPSFVSGQSADKEFIDIDPVTGRLLMTWTMFSTTSARIVSTYSDDLGATWSPLVTIYTPPSGGGAQASVPRWAGDGTTVYVTWRTTAPSTGARSIGFAKSSNGGSTWSAPVSITPTYAVEDQILGVDRVNNSPGMAVDRSNGRIYIVYQANNAVGEGDIAFQSSTDGGVTFTPRALINSNPGADRAQFYPVVTVDQSTGRVHAMWYDQDPQASGDVTEFMHTYSDDGGTTWSRPTPLFDHPFHAGYGNDTSQPNLGDYLQAVAVDGVLHSLATATSATVRFDEGQPLSSSMFSPDSYYDQLAEATAVASLRLSSASFAEGCPAGNNGYAEPRETVGFTFAVENYVANPITSPTTLTGIVGTLTSATPGVTILDAVQSFPNAAPLAVVSNATPFRVRIDPGFVAGTDVELRLALSTNQGSIELPYRFAAGAPGTPVLLIDENFEGATVPALPAGWTSAVGGGNSPPAWVTATTVPGGGVGSKMAFHSNTGTSTMWVRLYSPVVVVPPAEAGNVGYVTLDFDLAVSTEIEPSQAILAYDGLTLRITDQTAGSVLRSVLAEAFAEALVSGTTQHFPKHLPRSSSTAYFQDMSVWAGYSGGFVHVSMKFPGTGMNGRSIQLRFEYTEDSNGSCGSIGYPGPCGVAIDNLVMAYVPTTSTFSLAATATALGSDVNPADTGDPVSLAATVAPGTATGSVEFFEGATSLGTAPVSGGVATLVVSTLPAGPHVLHSVYSGDDCHAGSTSDDYEQVINNPLSVDGGLPVAWAITRLVPNPSAGTTRIGLALPREGHVSLAILDVQGREVATLVDGPMGAGSHDLAWNGRVGGNAATAGVYFVRLKVAGGTRVRRLVVMR